MVSFSPSLITKYTGQTNKLFYYLLAALLLFTSIGHAHAAQKFSASVDRNKIYEHDSITLNLTGNTDMDIGYGGLLGFGRSQLESPTFDKLEQDFEILDRQQSYSMRSVNGNAQTVITWVYTLAPKKTGKLVIPQASYKDMTTDAISIEVLPGRAPKDLTKPQQLFLEVLSDKEAAYVQEQVMYTVRLYSKGRLSSGNLSEPKTSNAIIEQFGEEKKYYKMLNNLRYEVIERNYLIFPQKSGQLTIDPLEFKGILIDSELRRRIRISDASDALSLEILSPPPTSTAKHWLPAKSLYINESWSNTPEEITVGDAITRTIEIEALGLLGSALPPTQYPLSDMVKAYPDQAEVSSSAHNEGAQANRKESVTYIAIEEGIFELPEIIIPWWDTINNVQREAKLPPRTIKILPGNKLENHEPEQTSTRLKEEMAPVPTSAQPQISHADISESSTETSSSHGLWLLIALLAIGWLITSWYLLTRLKQLKSEFKREVNLIQPDSAPASISLKELSQLIEKNSSDIPRATIDWLNEHAHFEALVRGISDLQHYDRKIYEQLSAFEQSIYGSQHGTETGVTFTADALIALLKPYAKLERARPTKNKILQPLYP